MGARNRAIEQSGIFRESFQSSTNVAWSDYKLSGNVIPTYPVTISLAMDTTHWWVTSNAFP